MLGVLPVFACNREEESGYGGGVKGWGGGVEGSEQFIHTYILHVPKIP